MKARLKSWLAPPVFPGNEEKTHQAELVNAVIIAAAIFSIIVLTGTILGGEFLIPGLVVAAFSLGSCGVMYYTLQKGKVEFAGIGMIVLGIMVVTASIAILGTVRAPIAAVYLLEIMLAGLLFNHRGVVIATVLCSLAVVGLIVMENLGLLPVRDLPVNITQWITYTSLFGLTGGIILLATRGTKQALKRVEEELGERRQAEEKLRESEDLFKYVFDYSVVGKSITNPSGEVQVNQAFCNMTGYSPEELDKRKWQEITHPDDIELTQRQVDALLSGRIKSVRFTKRFIHKNGSVVWVDLSSTLRRDIDGKPLYLVTTLIDITERKKAELNLRESEKRFRSLFEQTHDAVFILDLYGHHLDANQRAANMLGYTREELKELSVNETSAEREKSLAVTQRLLAGETMPLYERLFRKKDGQILPVEINVELVRDANGKPLHIQSVVRDISERKQAEEALRIANEKLQERIRDVERLHDELREQSLHDPLTGLYNRRYLSETLTREIARVKRENNQLSIIISDIDFFKDINDTYGHQVGDKFLMEVSSLMKKNARGSDIVCRYGGEEFLLVIPGASTNDAAKRADELRQKCEKLLVQHNEQKLAITMSFGIATYPNHDLDPEKIIIKADRALYQSKNAGRNRVTVWKENQLSAI